MSPNLQLSIDFCVAFFKKDAKALQQACEALSKQFPSKPVIEQAFSFYAGSHPDHASNLKALEQALLAQQLVDPNDRYRYLGIRQDPSFIGLVTQSLWGNEDREKYPKKQLSIPVLETLVQWGLKMDEEITHAFLQAARNSTDPEILSFLGRHQFCFNAENLNTFDSFLSYQPPQIIFRAETAKDLQWLGDLCDQGVFINEPGALGVTDFLAEGQLQCAEILLHKGFSIRPITLKRSYSYDQVTPHPASSLITGQDSFWLDFHKLPPDQQPQALEAFKTNMDLWIDRFKAHHIDFYLPATEGDYHKRVELDPLLKASETDSYRYGAQQQEPHCLFKHMAEVLIKAGANPNGSPYLLNGALHSLENMDITTVDKAQPFKDTLLEHLISLGLDAQTFAGYMIGQMARFASPKNTFWFDQLLTLGIDVSKIPSDCKLEQHPIANALFFRDPQPTFVKHIHAKGVKADWVEPSTGYTLFHVLAEQGTPGAFKSLEALLKDQSLLHLLDKPQAFKMQEREPTTTPSGETPLHLACGKLNNNQAEALLKAGANPNAVDVSGYTALHHAGCKYGAKAQKKCTDLIELLLKYGADPGLCDKKGKTPAQIMAKKSPLGSLEALLSIRPDDLLGNSKAAKQMEKNIRSRGSEAVSFIEKAILTQELSPGPAQSDAPAKKRKTL